MDEQKPIKKGFWNWIHQVFNNNKDLDSTGLLLIVGGGAILNQVLGFISPSYAATAPALAATEMYDKAVMAMVFYFFMKGNKGSEPVNGGQK